MRGITSVVFGFVVLLGWLQIAGPANPHVVELSIGVVLAIAAGLYLYFSGLPKLMNWWEEKMAKAKSFVKEKTPPKS